MTTNNETRFAHTKLQRHPDTPQTPKPMAPYQRIVPRRLRTYTPLTCLLAATTLFTSPLNALILYSGDNSANQTAPSNGAPFDSVARICNADGSGTTGSAVYLRDKYLLTANHVTNRSHITFDGTSFWARDTSFSPIQVSSTDMKIIKLMSDPGLPNTILHTSNSIGQTGTLIGWGRGRDESIDDQIRGRNNLWAWGNDSTIRKRWGTNVIDREQQITSGGTNYLSLVSDLDNNEGASEATAITYDSGCGLFIQTEQDWKLAGITTLAYSAQLEGDPTKYSYFNGSSDGNHFADIRSYASEIENIIKYSVWKEAYGLADTADSTDPDADGINNLLEYALNGDPTIANPSILPQQQLVDDNSQRYLELHYTRTANDNGLTYNVNTTEDLSSWPSDGSGVNAPSIIDNGDGTETWTYRRTTPVDSSHAAFMRLDVSN